MAPTPVTPRGEPAKDPELQRRLHEHLSPGYTVEDELGGGGMSRVFVAEDHSLSRKVVIKVLPPSLAATVSVDRFRREIMLAAKLQHPHIVPVLAAGELGDLPYFVMPYIEGESLRPRIQRGPLSVRETVSIMRDIARALSFAHRLGIVHRDIKPDNVLLSAGAAVVTDFGVAKAIAVARDPNPQRGATITAIGVSLGTPQYMAPEQAAADPSADHRADLYALGIVGYEMLAGVPPFHGRGPHELLTAQLTEAPQPLSSRRYDVPVALAQLIMQCLEKNPANRPKTASDVVRVLESSEAVSGEFAAPAAAAKKKVSRNRIMGALGITFAVAAMSIWLVAGGTGDPASKLPHGNALDVAWLDPIGEPADSGLARTITSDLSNALTSVPGLRVLAPPDPFALGIDTARASAGMRLTGTVQQEGDRVRVNLRLAAARTDSTLWTGRFDGKRGELLSLEDEIASAAVLGIRAQVDPP